MSARFSVMMEKLLQNPAVAVIQASSILHCINEYAFGITMVLPCQVFFTKLNGRCAGPSMMPTFNMAGDVVFVDKFSSRRGNVARGDVIIANTPQNAKQMVCKRVIGMAGDRVMVRRSWHADHEETLVPQGHVWLEGDNASNSTDSRVYGPVPLAMVRGRVFLKAWPLSQLGIVSRQIPNGVSRVTRTTGLEDGSAAEDVGHYRFSSDIEEELENRAGSRNDIKEP